MKPAAFDYADPKTLEEALDLIAEHGDDSTVIAGGQSLVPLLNLRLARPEIVVDLRHVNGLASIEADEDCLRAGAMVQVVDLEGHPSVGSVPGLSSAISFIAHSQIRARTTVGGSIAHADPAAELPALLLALEGSVVLCSKARGERVVPAEEFFLGSFWTARESDEIITSVVFPRYPGSVQIDEVAPRPGDFALVGVVIASQVKSGVISDPRIVLFGVAGTPVRASQAEALLTGAVPSLETFAAAATEVLEHLSPLGDVHGSADYRRHLAGVLVERNLVQAHG